MRFIPMQLGHGATVAAVYDRRYPSKKNCTLKTVMLFHLVHKPRLHRLEWVYKGSPIYFVTTCTHQRRAILANTMIHRVFVNFSKAAANQGAFVGCYVLMPDHVHLFVCLAPETTTLSSWMKSLKNALSKELRQVRIAAPHWQKGFFDHVLRSSESYSEKWQYVANNPVRAGLVRTTEEWAFQGEIHHLEF